MKGFILYESSYYSSGSPPGWTVTKGNGNFCGYTSVCQRGNTIFKKSINNLPSHYKFELELLFEGLEGFTGNTFNIYLDGVIQGTFIFPMNTINYSPIYYPAPATYGYNLFPGYFSFTAKKSGFSELINQNLCGGQKKEQIYALKVLAEHNSSTMALQLSFSDYAGSSNWKLNYYNYKVWTKGISSTCDLHCTNCISGARKYCGENYLNQEGVCVTACTTGYKSLNGKCFACHSSCLDCSDDDPNSCSSCYPNYWLLNGACVMSCPTTGYYANFTNHQCVPCYISCATCNGAYSNNCASCETGKYFSTGSCLSTCPANQYLNSTNKTCLNCSSACQTCYGPLTNNCLSCVVPKYWDYFSCVTTCYSYQYLDSSNNSCINCDASCLTCSGSYSNSCLSCTVGKIISYGTCVSVCNSNQYYNLTNNSCLNCDASCLSCVGPYSNNCTSCPVSMYFSYGSCPNSCNSSQYLNSSNNSCINCDFSCQTCNGPYSNQCVSCPAGTYFSYGSCIPACNSTQYLNATNNSCLNCYPTCQTCSGPNYNNCTTCPPTVYFYAGICGNYCNSSQYLNTTNNYCIDCDLSCQSCNGPFANNCTSCQFGKLYSYGTCVDSCNASQYLKSANSLCLNCDSTCLTCNGPLSIDCLSCDPLNYYWYSGTCIQSCLSSQYINSSNVSCADCDSSCFTCNGPSPSNCITCILNFFFSYGYCLNMCPLNQYLDSSNISCSYCDMNCETCDGPLISNCTTCLFPLYFSNGYCVSSCSMNQFVDIFYSCQFCDQTCQTCSGASPSNCTTCPQGNYLYQGLCKSSCPVGYFANLSDNSCVSCSNSCFTCFGDSYDNCLSCLSGKFLLNSQCLQNCPSKYYGDIGSNICISCDPSCLACNGPANNNCLSCINQTVYTFSHGYCLRDICLINQYFDGVLLSCQNCSLNCASCSGPNSNNCLSCIENFILFNETDECKQPVEIYFTVIAIKNPAEFLLNFVNTSQISLSSTFFKNINKTTTITVSNFGNDLFNYTLQKINTTDFKLSLTYNDNIYADTSYLFVNLNNSIDSTISLMNTTAKILLLPFALCTNENTYYENKTCHKKVLIDYSWMRNGEYNQILLLFSQSNYDLQTLHPVLVDAFRSKVFFIVKTSSSNKLLFNYSFINNSDSITVDFTFNDFQFVKQDFSLKQNVTQLFNVKDSQKISIVQKVIGFSIINNYYQSNELNLMNVTLKTTNGGFFATTIFLYLSYLMNSKSTFAMKGLMTTYLFQLSKFVEIMFPMNARMIFTNFSKNTYFFKEDVYPISPIQQLLQGLPQIFISFNTSLYILNDILNDYILILVCWGVALFCLIFLHNKNRCERLFGVFRSFFAWNFLISISMSKYITTSYHTFVCLRFGLSLSKFNSFLVVIFLFYLILFPLHLFKVISLIVNVNSPLIQKNQRGKKNESPSALNLFTLTESVNNLITPSPKKSRFFIDRKSLGETATVGSPLKHVQSWSNFKDYKTPTLNNLIKIEPLESEKLPIGSYNSKKVIPWEFLAEPESLLIKQSLGNDIMTSIDLFESKSKIAPFPKNLKIQTKAQNINSSICNFTNASSSNEIVIKKRSSSVFCFRFFWIIYDYLYKIKDAQKYQRRYNVLIRDFNPNNQFQIVLDFARYFTISAVIVMLYGFTVLQMTIISFINLIYLLFLIFSQPFIRKRDFYFNVFNEVCLNAGFAAVFILSCLDIQEKIELNLRINLGWVYVFSYIFLLFSLICSSLIRIVLSFKLIWNQVRNKIKK